MGLKDALVGKKVRCPKCMEPFAAAAQEATGRSAEAGHEPMSRAEPDQDAGGLSRTCPECDGKVPVNESRCPECGANYRRAMQQLEPEEDDGRTFAPERKAMNAGVLLRVDRALTWFTLLSSCHPFRVVRR